MKNPLLRPLSFLSALVPLAFGPACVFYGPRDDPFGDISFDWSFGGIPSCAEAGVDEVDIVVLSGAEVVAEIDAEPCVGGGLTITEILEGRYEVVIDAFDRSNVLLYTGSFSIRVEGGEDNYAGVVDLDPVNGPARAPTGNVELTWSFLYPSDEPVFDCAYAGVVEVDVFVTARGGGVVFEETYWCEDVGVFISALPAGRYDVEVLGWGLYEDDYVLLYDSGVVAASVRGGVALDFNGLVLDRVEESFADVDVAWALVGESCASAGVEDVVLAITRDGFASPELEALFDCQTPSTFVPSFVPGFYTVSVFGEGEHKDYAGGVLVDLRPGTVTPVDVFLTP